MDEFKIKAIPAEVGSGISIPCDRLKKIISKHLCECGFNDFSDLFLRRSTGVISTCYAEIYEADWVSAKCKNTGEKKMGYVYFKDGSFFIEDVCFPYLTDFKL
jgi:hypothetical protein